MVAVTPRLQLEDALRHTTSTTVTGFLEQLVGEPLEALDRQHLEIEADVPNLLGVEQGHLLLARSTMLKGTTSGQSYLHARSLLVPSRLPPGFCRQLEATSDPIGRILVRHRVEFDRSPLPGLEPDLLAVFTDAVPDGYLLSRTYRVAVNGEQAMLIGEWFLAALEQLLGAS